MLLREGGGERGTGEGPHQKRTQDLYDESAAQEEIWQRFAASMAEEDRKQQEVGEQQI